MDITKDYYFKDPATFLRHKYNKKSSRNKRQYESLDEIISVILSNPANYEIALEQMEAYNIERYESKTAGPAAISDETWVELIDNLQEAQLKDRKENPEKYKQIHEDIANTLRENGTYEATSIRMKEFRANQDIEEQRANAKKMNDTLSNTPGKRESMAINAKKTNAINRKKYLEEEILPIIKQETDWFDKWICNKYKLPGRRRGYGVKDKQFKNILTELVKGGYLEKKMVKFNNDKGSGRKLVYKIVAK